eukprot:5717708-Prymnesium_polylepis.1
MAEIQRAHCMQPSHLPRRAEQPRLEAKRPESAHPRDATVGSCAWPSLSTTMNQPRRPGVAVRALLDSIADWRKLQPAAAE